MTEEYSQVQRMAKGDLARGFAQDLEGPLSVDNVQVRTSDRPTGPLSEPFTLSTLEQGLNVIKTTCRMQLVVDGKPGTNFRFH